MRFASTLAGTLAVFANVFVCWELQASEDTGNAWMPHWAQIFEEACRGLEREEDHEAAPLARLRSDWQACCPLLNSVNSAQRLSLPVAGS